MGGYEFPLRQCIYEYGLALHCMLILNTLQYIKYIKYVSASKTRMRMKYEFTYGSEATAKHELFTMKLFWQNSCIVRYIKFVNFPT